jgi:DNA-binding XRE family transcriptional regulator
MNPETFIILKIAVPVQRLLCIPFRGCMHVYQESYALHSAQPCKPALSMLREQLELSQVEMAHRLGISQPSVANLEKRGQEIKLSSLKRYVEAMGGKLTVDVQFPDGRHIGMNF